MTKENFFDVAYSLKSEAETKAMYDRWSEVYDQDLTKVDYQQPVRCAKALSDILLDKEAKILDVGCGTGLSGLALKEAGYNNFDGCDLSEGMLEKASELTIYNRLFACNLNIPPLDPPNESYDAITAVGVFSFGHINSDALDELLRIVKSKSPIIIGLNDHYYEEGSLIEKLEALQEEGALKIIRREHGDHIPANNLKGWVLTIQKT